MGYASHLNLQIRLKKLSNYFKVNNYIDSDSINTEKYNYQIDLNKNDYKIGEKINEVDGVEEILIEDETLDIIFNCGVAEYPNKNQDVICLMRDEIHFFEYVKKILFQIFASDIKLIEFVEKLNIKDVESINYVGEIGAWGKYFLDDELTNYDELITKLYIDIKYDNNEFINESEFEASCSYDETNVEGGLNNSLKIESVSNFRLMDLYELSDVTIYDNEKPILIEIISIESHEVDLTIEFDNHKMAPSVYLLPKAINNASQLIKIYIDNNMKLEESSISTWRNIIIYMVNFNESVYEIAKTKCKVFLKNKDTMIYDLLNIDIDIQEPTMKKSEDKLDESIKLASINQTNNQNLNKNIVSSENFDKVDLTRTQINFLYALSFIFPPLGFIMYSIYKENSSVQSEIFLVGAIIGLLGYFVFFF